MNRYHQTDDSFLLEGEDSERLAIIYEMMQKARNKRNFNDSYLEKAYDKLIDTGIIPREIYNSLVNIYYAA